MLPKNIFKHLFTNDEYFNKAYPHLYKELFVANHQQIIYDKIKYFTQKYNKRPKISDIKLIVESDYKVNEDISKDIVDELDGLKKVDELHIDMILDETEQFVKDRTMEIAILDSVEILENNKPRGLIQDKIKNALSISFTNDVGHDYKVNAQDQYDFYTTEEAKYPCDITELNNLLGGGYVKKALYVYIGKVNSGKSIFLCHMASALVRSGLNVVLLTAEMAKERMVQRIDANILDIEMDELAINLSETDYFKKVKNYQKTEKKGQLFVQEYPTGTANKNHISAYLNELKIKKNFKADIVIADYLNIFTSARMSGGDSANSYLYVKSIAEEFRALAVEEDIAVITATQLNRESANKGADTMDMTGTSESWGVPATADWMGAIIQSPELFDANKYLVKNIKTRFSGNLNEVVTIGVDRPKMRLLNLAMEDQEIPISVKDKMDFANKKRSLNTKSDEDTVFVWEDELG